MGAVLDAILIIDKVAAAAVFQCIERAVAEQTVEIIRVIGGMAREILAFLVIEK
jgi:hypothetical protein